MKMDIYFLILLFGLVVAQNPGSESGLSRPSETDDPINLQLFGTGVYNNVPVNVYIIPSKVQKFAAFKAKINSKKEAIISTVDRKKTNIENGISELKATLEDTKEDIKSKMIAGMEAKQSKIAGIQSKIISGKEAIKSTVESKVEDIKWKIDSGKEVIKSKVEYTQSKIVSGKEAVISNVKGFKSKVSSGIVDFISKVGEIKEDSKSKIVSAKKEGISALNSKIDYVKDKMDRPIYIIVPKLK